MPSGCDKVL